MRVRTQVDEHDDDLESVVHEDAEKETESYPDSADELEEADDLGIEDEPSLDPDESEL